MKKKMEIQVHTTDTEPQDYTPFSMMLGSMWRAYEAGEINSTAVMMLHILYKKVNPYNGRGYISYAEICVQLKEKPTELNVNGINKLMKDLRDEHHLIWFPNHSGSREFPYLIDKFKLAPIDKKDNDKWVNIEPNFQSKTQSGSRGDNRTLPKPSSEPMPRQPQPEQRLERSNDEGMTRLSEFMKGREIRPPQTDTES
jgi:hypothetical protein